MKHPLWLIAAAVLVVLPSAAACGMGSATSSPSPSPVGAQATASPTASLRVRVRLLRTAGQPTATVPGGQTPPPTARPYTLPVPGVRVRVLTADAPPRPVGEEKADAQGQASFALPPGHYWVLTPWDDRKAIFGCENACGRWAAPDGQSALALKEVTVPGTGTTEAELTVVEAGQ